MACPAPFRTALRIALFDGRAATLICLLLAVASAPSGLFAKEPVAQGGLVALDGAGLRGAWLVPGDSPRTTVTLVVLAGERDNGGESGLAHYAEHLVWLSAIDDGAGRAGRDSNASTDQVMTRYFLDGPGEEVGDMLATLGRIFVPIDLPVPFMREEVGIVQREYDRGMRESPDAAFAQELSSLQHGEQWPAVSVIGTPDSIARLTPGAAIDWQARTHRPDNTVLLVHGDHDPGALNALLRETFAAPEAGSPDESHDESATANPPPLLDVPAYRMLPDLREVLERIEPRFAEPQIRHSRLAPLPADLDPAELDARLTLLWWVLDSTRPGGLAGPLRFDDFIARGYDLGLSSIEGRYVELQFTAWPDRGIDNRTLLERFESTLLDTARAGIPVDTFERVRAGLLDDIDQTDEPDAWVMDIAFDALAQGTQPTPLSEWRAQIAAVTLAQTDDLLDALAEAPRVITLSIDPGE